MNQSLIKGIVQRVSQTLENELVLAQGDGKKPKRVDLAFEALAKLEGGTRALTPSARGAVNRALREIRTVSPHVTGREIDYRIGNFRKVFGNNCAITAMAIARHWGRLA